jgi:hypothetical protein
MMHETETGAQLVPTVWETSCVPVSPRVSLRPVLDPDSGELAVKQDFMTDVVVPWKPARVKRIAEERTAA